MAENAAFFDDRAAPRSILASDVRAFGPDAQPARLAVVNISSGGLSAQSDRRYAVGDRLCLLLPGAGVTHAEIRWAEGERFGCRFDVALDLATYYEMLADLTRDAR